MKVESKALEFIYQDTQIHFLLGNEKNVMVNATEMAKVFNRRIDFFLKTEPTKAFIEALKFPPVGGNLDIKSDDDIMQSRGRNGTYFHRILALKFAAWLDPNFEVWVYAKIEETLFGNAKTAGEKISEVTLQEEKIKQLRKDILKSGSEDAKNLLKEEANLVAMKKEKNKAVSIFVKSNQPEFPFE